MRADGATVVETRGSYEEAVALAAAHGDDTGATVVSDTAWPGYERIPRLIMGGYTRLFDEAALTWSAPPDVVLVQGGVGGLVCAAANWFAHRFGPARPFLIACEPDNAACLLESARAGHPVNLIGERVEASQGTALQTIMAGLRCAEPSPAAWPSIQAGIDAFMSVSDQRALDAIDVLRSRQFTDAPIAAGPSGACSVAALIALMDDPAGASLAHGWPGWSVHASDGHCDGRTVRLHWPYGPANRIRTPNPGDTRPFRLRARSTVLIPALLK